MLLLVASIIFYIFNSPAYTLIYVAISLIVAYYAARYFEGRGKKKLVLIFTLVFIIGILAVLKYTNMFAGALFMILKLPYVEVKWVAPLAVSFYTLQLVSYILDCYWGVVKPEKNFLKLALYVIYFPQMVSGPISRFGELGTSLYKEHEFEYDRVVSGLKRIAWGLIKKIFVTARLKLFADAIFGDPASFAGLWIWFGMAMFVLELYADFSGCMDIIIGVSSCFGIKLSENFNAPFLAVSVQEFWQRWHISLGGFLRDYLMNPLLKSDAFIRLGKISRKIFGKKQGKKIPVYIAMLAVWIAMGIWHGSGWRYVLGLGLWFWFIIVLEQEFSPLTKKFKNNNVYKILCIIRTFIFVCIGNTFFRAASYLDAINMIRLGVFGKTNWGIVDLLRTQGIDRIALGDILGILVLLVFLIFMILHEILVYNRKDPFKLISRQKGIIRWGIYWIITLVVVYSIFGVQADFIYERF